MTFGEKVKMARAEKGLTQTELGAIIGKTNRSITAYETDVKLPRQGTMLKLAKALGVSIKFLTDDSCDNPMEDIEKVDYIARARAQYGSTGANEVDKLLESSKALFAGGDLSQTQKDAFFEALMTAYVTCKEEAKRKYGRKSAD